MMWGQCYRSFRQCPMPRGTEWPTDNVAFGQYQYVWGTGYDQTYATFGSGIHMLNLSYRDINDKLKYLSERIKYERGTTAPNPKATVAGVCTPSDAVVSAVSQPVVLTLYNLDKALLITRTVTLDPDGNFTASDLPLQPCIIRFEGDRLLARNLSVNTSSGYVSNMSVTLLAGDTNGDNRIDSADYEFVFTHLGTRAGVIAFDRRADVNGDGVVNSVDLNIVSKNMGQNGDAPPTPAIISVHPHVG